MPRAGRLSSRLSGTALCSDGYESDFRIGGTERSLFRFGDSPQMSNDTVFLDIVPNRRIVLAYSMANDGVPFSASLATIEFLPEADGTRLTCSEQVTFLDGRDNVASREAGCKELLEALAAFLKS
jgi:uncharacterized protein YndB with AHSA1/START domain